LSGTDAGQMARIVADLEAAWPGAAVTTQMVAMVSAIGSDLSEDDLRDLPGVFPDAGALRRVRDCLQPVHLAVRRHRAGG